MGHPGVGEYRQRVDQKVYARIDEWRNRPIPGDHPYLFVDGIWLKRTWGGEVRNVAVLVAVGVNAAGMREVLAVREGAKEGTASWRDFFRHLRSRGLAGVRLVVSDKCLGVVDAAAGTDPEARWPRCAVPFERNVRTAIPREKAAAVGAMLRAIYAALASAEAVAAKRDGMRRTTAANVVRAGAGETLTHFALPAEDRRGEGPGGRNRRGGATGDRRTASAAWGGRGRGEGGRHGADRRRARHRPHPAENECAQLDGHYPLDNFTCCVLFSECESAVDTK